MARTTPGATTTASLAAQEHGLGAWVRTETVNSDEPDWLLNGIISIVVSAVTSAVLVVTGYIRSGTGTMIAILMVGIFGFGLWCTVKGQAFHRVGSWLIHQFEHGLVMERTRAGILVATYEDVEAELYAFTVASEDRRIEYTALRLTFRGGPTVAMAEPPGGRAEALVELGQRCGGAAPESIDQAVARAMLNAERWRGPGQP